MAIPSRHSRPENILGESRTFFVTSSIWDKRKLLQSERSAELLIDVLYHYRERGKYLVHEFVIMPDHFHVLITVGAKMSIERAVQLIKGGYAFRGGRELGFRAPVWQKGFSEIRTLDLEAFTKQSEYIRNNPVRRRLVNCASQFPYSSGSGRFALDPAPQRLKPPCFL